MRASRAWRVGPRAGRLSFDARGPPMCAQRKSCHPAGRQRKTPRGAPTTFTSSRSRPRGRSPQPTRPPASSSSTCPSRFATQHSEATAGCEHSSAHAQARLGAGAPNSTCGTPDSPSRATTSACCCTKRRKASSATPKCAIVAWCVATAAQTASSACVRTGNDACRTVPHAQWRLARWPRCSHHRKAALDHTSRSIDFRKAA